MNTTARNRDGGTRGQHDEPASRAFFPQSLAVRLSLTLSLTLLASYAMLFGLWRSQIDTVVVPPLAASLSLLVDNIRHELQQRTPELRVQWIASLNQRGDVFLGPQTSTTYEPLRFKLMRSLEAELQSQLGADTHLQLRSRGTREVAIDFSAVDGRYEVALPSSVVLRHSGSLLALLVLLGAILWAALLFIVWQVNRPLGRVLTALSDSGEQLQALDMPASAPREFRVVAQRFNALAAEFAEQERERRLLLAGVSHDLRAPLTRMRLRAELLEDARAREGLIRDADAMGRIVDQFLAYHRDYRSDSDARAPEVIDAGDIVRRVVGGFAETGHDVQVEGEIDDGAARCRVTIGALALERLLTNLIDNALCHGAPPVQVRLARVGERVELRVRDHGNGIPAVELPRLLKPFERLDPARAANGHCGLGLAIVARLTAQCGGELKLHNADGGGLMACVSLPASSRG